MDSLTRRRRCPALQAAAIARPETPTVAWISHFAYGGQESYQISFDEYKTQLTEDAGAKNLAQAQVASVKSEQGGFDCVGGQAGLSCLAAPPVVRQSHCGGSGGALAAPAIASGGWPATRIASSLCGRVRRRPAHGVQPL